MGSNLVNWSITDFMGNIRTFLNLPIHHARSDTLSKVDAGLDEQRVQMVGVHQVAVPHCKVSSYTCKRISQEPCDGHSPSSISPIQEKAYGNFDDQQVCNLDFSKMDNSIRKRKPKQQGSL